jgi:prophage tail gpP-like protein
MSDASGAIAHGVATHGPPPGSTDVLTLTIGNQSVTGWQRVSVTRPLAAIPASFSIEVTERYPNSAEIVGLEPGAPCTVKIGADLVLTGYVDRYTSSIAASQHTIRVEGRSKSEDLVDCSALVENTSAGSPSTPGLQVVNGSTLDIVRKLAAPYGVTVQSTAGDGPHLPQFNINLGETVWEIIDRITRYSQMIVYDLPDGSIMLAEVGKESMSSGFTVGVNVEAADVMFSMDQRYSEYEGHLISMMALGTDAGVNMPGVGVIVHDDEVRRFRHLYIISEQFIEGRPIAGDRAAWEKNRRWGQSFNFNVTCDAWRDASGKLWEPNKLAPIDAPQLKLDRRDWLIGTVTYTRDESGQHARLGLWPPEAFSIEPTSPNMLTTNADVGGNNPTKPNADASPPTKFEPATATVAT